MLALYWIELKCKTRQSQGEKSSVSIQKMEIVNLQMRKNDKAVDKNIVKIMITSFNKNWIYIRCLWTQGKVINQNCSLWFFFMDWIEFLQVLCHYWIRYCIYCYLNKIPKLANHSFYILRIEKDWQNWLNYSDDLLVKLLEKSDTLTNKNPYFKHWFS